MSLRTRLFLLVGGLAAILVVAQWWLVRTLARDVTAEVGQVAFRVGEGVVASLNMLAPHGADPGAVGKSPEAMPGSGEPGSLEWMGSPDGASRLVTERQVKLREVEGKLVIVEENVRFARVKTGDPLPPAGTDAGLVSEPLEPLEAPAALARGRASADAHVFVLSVDASDRGGFLRLGSASAERHVPIPRAGVDDAFAAFRQRLLAGSATILAAGLALAALIAHRATAPLRELSAAARKVGSGAFGAQVAHGGPGEVGQAVSAFNTMSRRLAELDAESRRLREREHLTEIGEIARGLAHGLRNPLNALGLSVEELASGSAERQPLADAARRQIRRIDASVRSFLALAASATSAPEEDVDLGALVQDVALEVLQDARGRVSIGVEAGDPEARVRGVPAELRAVAQALVVNAAEASPDGARVSVAVTSAPGTVSLSVEDSGAGLADSVRERLFMPHVTTKANGSGMGLYLAHRIVAARLGGTLELHPCEGGGVRAVATFPSADGSGCPASGGASPQAEA